jgi:hypothetical protein
MGFGRADEAYGGHSRPTVFGHVIDELPPVNFLAHFLSPF